MSKNRVVKKYTTSQQIATLNKVVVSQQQKIEGLTKALEQFYNIVNDKLGLDEEE